MTKSFQTSALAYIPSIFLSFPGLVAAQSKRLGGISPAPFASLNLGLSSGDTPENVLENRSRFFTALGFGLADIALSFQVHDDKILLATKPGNYDCYDALITQQKNLFVGISVADCTPVLLYDAANEVVAAVHAGWKGTVKQIVAQTLRTMQSHFGTQSEHCYAYVGTCIGECTFEVDADVADHFATEFKEWHVEKNKFLVNLKAANIRQLLEFGIPESQIEVSPFCTVTHNEEYFSYRKEGKASGRMLAVIGVQK